jgi:type I restriction enzyme S subunit
MKEGWEYKKLGEVCDFEGGSQPPKSEWINHPQNGYIRMLQIRDFTKSRNVEIEYVKITKKLRLCKDDDILIGRYGASVGKILTGLAGAYNVAIIKSIPNEELIKKDFIRRYFESPLFQSILFKVCTSRAAQAGFSKDDIKDELIPLPPLSEQQRIVDYLDSAFAKIDAMKANAEKSLNEAKALFQASLKEMLEPKEGWEEKKFGKLCNFVRGPFGGSLKKECFKDSGYAVYEQQNAIYKKFTFRYFIDEEKYKSLNRFKVNAGDLIMSCSGTIGKVAIIPENYKEGIINQALLKLTPHEEIDALFLKYLMESNYFGEIINENIEGVAIKNIASVAVLKEIKLYIPKVNEQYIIVKKIDSLKSKVDRLQVNFDKMSQECDALKQAILRKVFE